MVELDNFYSYAGFILFLVSFFRVPSRKLTVDDKLVVCPADGKVVVIEETFDENILKISACRFLFL